MSISSRLNRGLILKRWDDFRSLILEGYFHRVIKANDRNKFRFRFNNLKLLKEYSQLNANLCPLCAYKERNFQFLLSKKRSNNVILPWNFNNEQSVFNDTGWGYFTSTSKYVHLKNECIAREPFWKVFQKYTVISVYLQVYKYISLLSLARTYVSTYGVRSELV